MNMKMQDLALGVKWGFLGSRGFADRAAAASRPSL